MNTKIYKFGKRGFAGMSRKKRTKIARLGGLIANKKGVAHKWNKEEAKKAGKKSKRKPRLA